jgi:MFS family permease
MLSALRPLHYRNFALLWWAALLSNAGSWMQTVAVGVLVTTRTGRPGWTGLVAAAGFLPNGLLSPLGGVMADRMDRRFWLFLTTAGETAFATCLTVLAATGNATPAVVTLLVFGGGSMAAIGFPAYQAMLPDLVPSSELGSAISLSSAQFNMGRVVGPALAGLAIVAGGYAWAFAINAGSFFAVLVALCLVKLPPVHRPSLSATLFQRLVDGGRATFASTEARLAVILISTVALTASPFIALVPAMAVKAFASKASGTSVLVTAQGIGAVSGSLALTPLARHYGRRRVLLASLVAVCVFLVAYGLAPDLWLGAAALVLVGAAYIGVLAGCNTIVQLYAPAELRGRMLGIYMMALGILYPVGALAQGAIADVTGIRAVTAGGAVVLLLLVAGVLRRRVPASLEGHPGPAAFTPPEVVATPVPGDVPAP